MSENVHISECVGSSLLQSREAKCAVIPALLLAVVLVHLCLLLRLNKSVVRPACSWNIALVCWSMPSSAVGVNFSVFYLRAFT